LRGCQYHVAVLQYFELSPPWQELLFCSPAASLYHPLPLLPSGNERSSFKKVSNRIVYIPGKGDLDHFLC
jgi:hypothetical protein